MDYLYVCKKGTTMWHEMSNPAVLVRIGQRIKDCLLYTSQLLNNILGAFAQFERDLIYERTQEGRRIAKEKGVKFGRKTLINKNNIAKQKSCIQLYESGTPVREIPVSYTHLFDEI